MYCSNCGKQLPDNTKFCSYCGARLAAETAPADAETAKSDMGQHGSFPDWSVPGVPGSDIPGLEKSVENTEPVREHEDTQEYVPWYEAGNGPYASDNGAASVYPKGSVSYDPALNAEKPNRKKKKVFLIVGISVGVTLLLILIAIIGIVSAVKKEMKKMSESYPAYSWDLDIDDEDEEPEADTAEGFRGGLHNRNNDAGPADIAAQAQESSAAEEPDPDIYSAYDRPEIGECEDMKDAIWSGLLDQGTPLTKMKSLQGCWKCYIIYDAENRMNSYCRELNTVWINGTADDVTLTMDWYMMYPDASEPYYETQYEDTEFAGDFSDGVMELLGPGRIRLERFCVIDDNEYALGSIILPDGLTGDIYLMRP